MKRAVTTLAILASGVIFAMQAHASNMVFDGTFTRDPGKPEVEISQFSAQPGSGTLRLENGVAGGGRKVTSAVVNLNGRRIFSPNDFSPRVRTFERKISLEAENSLEVELRGAKGSTFRVEIFGLSVPAPVAWMEATPAFIVWGDYAVLSWNAENADSCVIRPGIGPVELSGSLIVTPPATTTYTLTASGPGGTATESATVEVYAPEPFAELNAIPAVIRRGGTSRLVWSTQYAVDCTIQPDIGTVGPIGSLEVSPAVTTLYTLTAAGPGGEVLDYASVTVLPAESTQPEGSFGAFYEDLIPSDATSSYSPLRFAVVTGTVTALDGGSLPAVRVSILGHPGYGSVSTSADGVYSIPVEGGGALSAVLEKDGFLTVHRNVDTPWNDIAVADPVAMIRQDNVSTMVVFDGSPDTVTVHRSSATEDEWGTRACSVVFTGDTKAFSVDSHGNDIEELESITVRATEYPTLNSMPAHLPPAAAYTYCVELAADGMERVRFDKPVVCWVENFLSFNVGERVPSGFYDRDRGYWVPSADGYVVRLLDTTGDGRVDALDLDGDGLPDDIDGDGSFINEVSGLDDPSKYPPGSLFWRVEVDHFTPWDFNWPYGPPEDAMAPNPYGEPDADQQKTEGMDCRSHTGSFVEDRARILHQDIPIPGTNISLHYASNRVNGYRNIITAPASGEMVPSSLGSIKVGVEIAGRILEQVLYPAPGQIAEFYWDNLDHLGRRVPRPVNAHVNLDFVYDAVYMSAGDFERSFAQAGDNFSGIRARQEIVSRKRDALRLGAPAGTVAEGWTLSLHHSSSQGAPFTLYKGDGTVGRKDAYMIDSIAGDGFWGNTGDGGPATEARFGWSMGMTADACGNVYFSDSDHSIVRRISADGIIETVAGNGTPGYSGDGGPATEARLNWPTGLTVDDRGNLYIVDSSNNRIRMVNPSGIITTVAGNGMWGFSGDNCSATEAQVRMGYPFGMASDSYGNIYFTDMVNQRIRKVDPGGIITTVAGNGIPGFSGDGGPATEAQLFDPCDVYVDREGNLYIADNWNRRVRKIDKSGIITTVAGNGNEGYSGDGGPATEARIGCPIGVSVKGDGSLYILNQDPGAVRMVNSEGIITKVAGSGAMGYSGDGEPASEARLSWPSGMGIDPAGNLYILDSANYRIRKVGQQALFPGGMETGDLFFSEDSLGYVFSSAGLHKETVDLDTGITLYTFGYDGAGRLIAVTDQFGASVTIRRDGTGKPVHIASPDGVTTTLSIDENNRLSRITYPDGSHYRFEYTGEDLMTVKNEPEGNRYEYVFDSAGRLSDAIDQEGGAWRYSRDMDENGGIFAQVLSAEGNVTSYLDRTSSIGDYTSTITDPTGSETLFSLSADGTVAQKSSPCEMEFDFRYGFDRRHRLRYLNEMTERTPSGLERVTLRDRSYQDIGAGGLPNRVIETVSVNGRFTVAEKDLVGSNRKVISPEGRIVTTFYDPETLLTVGLSIPGLYETIYGYDSRGRVVSVKTHTRETSFSYDNQGFLGTVTDPEGRITSYDHDPMGRITGILRPDGTSVGFIHDRNGNMTVLRNPSGINHGFNYNSVNLNSSYQTPLSGIYSYVYDRDRRLVRTVFPSGKSIRNFYDKTRLIRMDTPEGYMDFSYLCGEKVGAVSGRSESITYGYDGKLVSSEVMSGTLNQSLGCLYDNDFNLTGLSYAGGVFSCSYDNDGLLTGAGEFSISRSSGNGLPEEVSGGALSIGRSFNGYGEVAGQDYVIGGLGQGSWWLGRNDSGKIIHRTVSRDGVSSDQVYSYDAMGRLLSVLKEGVPVEEYSYGPNGVRIHEMNLLRGISGRNFIYSDEDHLLVAGGKDYYYDYDGYLTKKMDGSDMTEYNYSSRGELLYVRLPDGVSIDYVYDPFGRRIARKVNGAVTDKYLWQGMTRLLAVFDGHNVLRMRFEYGDSRVPYAMEKDGVRYYFVHDHLGSPTAVVDAGGIVVKAVEYDSFGNVISDTAPDFEIPFGFAGGLHDPETGLIRFGFRDYDPDIGRWTAKDPIFFAGGNTDLYGYCLNDPINLVDEDGGFPQSIAAGALGGSIVGAINLASGLAKGRPLSETLKTASISAITAGVSIGLAATGIGFFSAGSITASTNILLQHILLKNVNIESALFSGFVTSAGGFAISQLDLKGVLLGLLAGQIAAPVALVGEQLLPHDRVNSSEVPCL